MATYQNLGQSAPTAGTATVLYTASAPTIISTISVCNTSASATTFRIAQRVAGAALAPQMYLYYDCAIAGNATAAFTLGISLATTDILSVQAGVATVSFNAWGVINP